MSLAGVPLILTAAFLVVAALWFAGGGAVDVAGVRISARNVQRPAIALALLSFAWIAMRRRRSLDDLVSARALCARRGVTVVLLLAAAAAVFSWHFGTHAGSGADSFGYVSQSRLWAEGTLLEPAVLPGRAAALAPLGYTNAADRDSIAPIYAPGLPLLMAGARQLVGECGVFLLAPLFAALAVIATFLLSRELGGRGAALAAALLAATSPVFLHAAVWPMSDVPAMALWTLALVCALKAGLRSAIAAGVLAGAAIAIRPNMLLVLVAFIAGVALLERGARMVWPLPRRAIAACLAALPFVLLVAAVQNHLHGAPWRSGYGPFTYLYELQNIVPNAVRYGGQLLEVQTPIVLLAFAASVRKRRALFFAAFTAAWVISYLPYAQFVEWWYLRFFLGMLPLLLVLAVSGLTRIARPASAPRLAVAWALVTAAAAWGLYVAISRGVMVQREFEQRYVTVARYIDRHLPANAALISMQHSGSVRYYAGRLTVRYDLIGPDELTGVLEELQRTGYRPYVLIEDWEFEGFTSRFNGNGRAGALDVPLIARMSRPAGVRLYDPLDLDPVHPGAPPASIVQRGLERCPMPASRRNW